MPERLKLPNAKYDGRGNPAKHLETYKLLIELNSSTNTFKCRAFMITFTDFAQRWFRTLQPGSFHSFHQLSKYFISQFNVNKVQRKLAKHLYTITQCKNESTEAHLNCFVKDVVVEQVDQEREYRGPKTVSSSRLSIM